MELRCQIKWIDRSGNQTPDISPAAYVAVCLDRGIGKKHFLCCEKHYQMGLGYSGWTFVPLEYNLELIKAELGRKLFSLFESVGA